MDIWDAEVGQELRCSAFHAVSIVDEYVVVGHVLCNSSHYRPIFDARSQHRLCWSQGESWSRLRSGNTLYLS